MMRYGIINTSDVGNINHDNLVLNGVRYNIAGNQALVEWTTDEIPSDIEPLLIGEARNAEAMRAVMNTPAWQLDDEL